MALDGSVWNGGPAVRVFVGISLGSRSGRLKASLLRCRGQGWGLRCLAADALTVPAPPRRQRELAHAITRTIDSLAKHCAVPVSAVDVIGLHGILPEHANDFVAALVAEQTGATVVSGFELRDRACGGRGVPLDPVPDWFLFHSARLCRLLVHLGPALRITFLGAGERPRQAICFDVGPCCDFLDGLAQDLSGHRFSFDPSGHFAVQGRHCEELISQWLSHPYLLGAPPKVLSGEEFGESLRESSLAFARERRYSARDVLCSANQFVARNLREAVSRFLPNEQPIDEIWVSGGGSWNGLLWKLLQDTLAPIPVARIDEAGIPSEARGAVHGALLAYFTMENLAGNLPTLSGAKRSCVLGHITPGAPENWDRWVCNLAYRFEVDNRQAA